MQINTNQHHKSFKNMETDVNNDLQQIHSNFCCCSSLHHHHPSKETSTSYSKQSGKLLKTWEQLWMKLNKPE